MSTTDPESPAGCQSGSPKSASKNRISCLLLMRSRGCGDDDCEGQEVDLDKSRRVIGGQWCNDLVPGGPYFTVSYQEGGVNLPEVETLVYLGWTELNDGESGAPQTHFMFQLARSYQMDGNWADLPEERRTELSTEAEVMFYDEDSVGSIADIDGLLVLLTGLRERMRRGLGWDRVLPE
jgi:hypothetical protein